MSIVCSCYLVMTLMGSHVTAFVHRGSTVVSVNADICDRRTSGA